MTHAPRPTPTIVVTGATGFLGRRLVRTLVEVGAKVAIITRPTSDQAPIADLVPVLTVHPLGAAPLSALFTGRRVDAVIHLATAYGRKGEAASDILESNVGFPLRLLEAAADHAGITFFNADSFFNTATALPEGLNYYALSKSQFRDYGTRLAAARDMRFVNVRIEHIYGPGDDAAKFLPSLLRTLLANQPSLPLTAGGQRRDFVYVDDVVSAYVALVAHRHALPSPIATVDVGSGASVPLREIVELARQLTGSHTALEFGALPYRAGEIMESHADLGVLHGLGWAPAVALADGLECTIASLRAAATPAAP